MTGSLATLNTEIGTTRDLWVAEGRAIAGRMSSSAWELGDWWNRRAADWQRADGAAAVGMSVGSLDAAALVARRFPQASRRLEVPFGVHQAVATLSDEQALPILDRGATVGQARAEVKRLVAERTGTVVTVEAPAEVVPEDDPAFTALYDWVTRGAELFASPGVARLAEVTPADSRGAVAAVLSQVGAAIAAYLERIES